MLVAGAIITPALAAEAAEYVDASDFENPKLAAIWASILLMLDKGCGVEEIDCLSIGRYASKNAKIQHNIAMYASDLLDGMPKFESLVNSAQRVKRRATLKKALAEMRSIAGEIKEQLEGPDGDVPDLGERLSNLSVEVAKRSDMVTRRTVYADRATEITKYFDQLAVSQDSGSIPTGIKSIDFKLGGGLRPGQLHSVLGGTGSGKTAFASQVCDEAVKRGHRAIMFSMEVDPLDVYVRDVERKSGVSRWKLRDGNKDARERAQVTLIGTQASMLTGEEGKVVYGEPMSVEGIRQAVLTERLRGGEVQMIAVDHAQVAAPSLDQKRSQPRYLEVKDTAEALRRLAQHLKIAVVLTAQLNPPQKGERPSMALVREGKDIVNASEVVMLIWHEKEAIAGEEITKQSWVMIEKARAGMTGKVPVFYRGEVYRFEDQYEE
jgi:replicative DNA helicase